MPVHLQVGKETKVAVVFSCPGRHEELAGHPAAQGTGRNLEILLALLARALRRDDLTRENITITNAWPGVEYRARTGRSEATLPEVVAPDNVKRLQEELAEVTDFIIFCGAKAKAAARQLKLKHQPRLVYIRHPGLRGLSLISSDVEGERIVAAEIRLPAGSAAARRALQSENTRRRLAVLAGSIVRQLAAQCEEPPPLHGGGMGEGEKGGGATAGLNITPVNGG